MPNEIPYKSFCWALGIQPALEQKILIRPLRNSLRYSMASGLCLKITERPGRVIITHRHATMII